MLSVPVEAIKRRDAECRPQYDHDMLSAQLSALYDDRARQIVINHLELLGTGDPKIKETGLPIMAQVVRRVVDSLAVLYVVPPNRRLIADGKVMADDTALMEVVRSSFERSDYAAAWKKADELRSLHRQVMMSFDEDHRNRAVSISLCDPSMFWRHCGPTPRSSLEYDEWILMKIAGGPPEGYTGVRSSRRDLELFYAWHQVEEGVWRCWMCDGSGGMLPDDRQPYGPEGKTPFDGLPMVLLHDEYTSDPWLPIPESRVAFAHAVNSQLNDLAYLVVQEAHEDLVFKTDSGHIATPTSNPGSTHRVSAEDDLKVLERNPKILESIGLLDSTLQTWAVSESIPVDSVLRKRGDMTGDAIVASERDLQKRRQEKQQAALRHERLGFEKYKLVHNGFAQKWGVLPIPEDVTLSVSLGRQLRGKSPEQNQNMLFKEMAAGLASAITYLMAMHGMTRDEAIEHYHEVQSDREDYPLLAAQPPGAIVDDAGPLASLGEGSATRERGVFHNDVAGASERASVVGTMLSLDKPDS